MIVSATTSHAFPRALPLAALFALLSPRFLCRILADESQAEIARGYGIHAVECVHPSNALDWTVCVTVGGGVSVH